MDARACIYVTCLGSEIVCVCQICQLLRRFVRESLCQQANLFSANEPDLYGEVCGLSFGRCVCFLKVFDRSHPVVFCNNVYNEEIG
jgi:hypothetical protein